jgi:hypothetical protein
MGTGSFGGGSGSYGGGGSGSSGTGLGVSGPGTSLSGGGGSVAQLIKSLLNLTKSFNRDPSVAGARRALSSALQDPGRRDFFIGVLRSPFVQAVFDDLLDLARDNAKAVDWKTIASRYDLDPQLANLAALVRALLRKHQGRSTDERHLEAVRNSLSDLFLGAIGNDTVRYVRMTPAEFEARFDNSIFPSISGYFLSALMRRAVRLDLGDLKPDVAVSMETASREIADGWYQHFETSYFNKGSKRRDVLAVIADNYSDFAGLRTAGKVAK